MRISTERPYPETGLTSKRWLTVPLEWVEFSDLTTTQDGIYLHALLDDTEPVGGDRVPHVVRFEGELYLEDGHTRVARLALLGRRGVWARVWETR